MPSNIYWNKIMLVSKQEWLVWTYNLANDLMVELETIIALAIMIYIVETNLYELHPMDEQVFTNN